MTLNVRSADAGHPVSASAISVDRREAARQAREASRRKYVILFVGLAAAARFAADRRTLVTAVVVAVGLVAAARR